MERWEEKETRQFIRAGTIAASFYNAAAAFGGSQRTFTAYDIFKIKRPEVRPDISASLANAELMLKTINAAHAKRANKARTS